MQLRRGSADIGPLRDDGRRQADRHIRRKLQIVQRKILRLEIAGERASVGGELVLRLGKLGFQRRQRRLLLGELGLLLQHLRLRHAPEAYLGLQNAEQLPFRLDDLIGGVDLRPQRGDSHRRGDDIGSEREIRGLQFVALIFGLGRQPFHAAARPAPQRSSV